LGKQQAMQVVYEPVRMDIGFRADLVVNGKGLSKSNRSTVAPSGPKTALDLLASNQQTAWLTDQFHVELIKDGITRMANNL